MDWYNNKVLYVGVVGLYGLPSENINFRFNRDNYYVITSQIFF